jgi:folate-dependent phosphoribosylglycinamide formyltransferase PurN
LRFILTAGYTRSYHTLALAELLRRRGDEVAGLIVVSALNLRRARTLLRQRGVGFAIRAVRLVTGRRYRRKAERDPLEVFLQEHGIPQTSLRTWARQHGIECRTVGDINDRRALELISTTSPDAVLYGGGGILRDDFLAAAKRRVLNAHSGPLPEVRGMNACEWSVLLGLDTVVTIHRIDRGIDTGAPVMTRPVSPEPGDTLDAFRARCVVEGVRGLLGATAALPADWVVRPGLRPRSRQCFIMAPVLRELVATRMIASDRGAPDV